VAFVASGAASPAHVIAIVTFSIWESEMTRIVPMTLIAMLLLPGPVQAETPQIDVPEEAQAAAATVDRFFAALSAGELDKAGAELDPSVIILEGGGAEHSAAEYLGGHARSDAEFLKTVQQRLLRRSARVSGGLAWIASEAELDAQQDGKPVTIASTETMVLRSTDAGWKIVHIHWSSRARKQ
jgi:ketosteroid isomerase-like protein